MNMSTTKRYGLFDRCCRSFAYFVLFKNIKKRPQKGEIAFFDIIPFTLKSDHTVWRTWLFIAYSDNSTNSRYINKHTNTTNSVTPNNTFLS